MLNSSRNQFEKAAGSFEETLFPKKSYKEESHPLEYYVKGDRDIHAGVIYN